jgi:hypothetical protein
MLGKDHVSAFFLAAAFARYGRTLSLDKQGDSDRDDISFSVLLKLLGFLSEIYPF